MDASVRAIALATVLTACGGVRPPDTSASEEPDAEQTSGGLDADRVRERWEREERARQERERREAFMNRARARSGAAP